MGAWGTGNFENDDALDFVAEVQMGGGLALLEETFSSLPPAGQGYVDATSAARVLAAAEIVAALCGLSSRDYPQDLGDLAAAFGAPAAALVEAASEAVSRVLFDSELLELWAESDHAGEWNREMTGLIKRLSQSEGQVSGRGRRAPGAERLTAMQCPYCLECVAEEDLILVTVSNVTDDPLQDKTVQIGCHLSCFNAALHPKRVIQMW